MFVRSVVLLLWIGLSWQAGCVFAADLDGWRLVQMSPGDQLAVFKSPDGQLQLLRPDDRLGEQIVLTGFDGEQVVLEKPGEWGRVTLFVSLVAGRQSIARRERQPLRKAEFSGAPGTLAPPLESPAPAAAR